MNKMTDTTVTETKYIEYSSDGDSGNNNWTRVATHTLNSQGHICKENNVHCDIRHADKLSY